MPERLGRNTVGIELMPEYVRLAQGSVAGSDYRLLDNRRAK